MSVVRSANVISASANGDVITGPFRIDDAQAQAGGSGFVFKLRKGTSSGAVLLEGYCAANESLQFHVRLRVPQAGAYLEVVSGSGTLYLDSN